MKTLSFAVMVLLLIACGERRPNADSKSHWLTSCERQSDCGGGLACVCGVCTSSCADARSCNATENAQEAACMDLVREGLPADCAAEASSIGASVCLQVCTTTAECGDDQRCVNDGCISAEYARTLGSKADGGLPGSGGRPATVGDGGMSSVEEPVTRDPDPVRDSGSVMRRPIEDGGPDTGTLLPDGGWSDCGGSLGECCTPAAPCNEGLVCHFDRTCAEPGVADENGVATLGSGFPEEGILYAVDQQFVYGSDTQHTESANALIRWPLAGGQGEAIADGMTFYFASRRPLVVDEDHLYFAAASGPGALSASLWRLPVDDIDAPEPYGTIGSSLVMDESYLYFSNDGDSRVIRLAKDMIGVASARQQIYVSELDAPRTIRGLAVNGDALFVWERPPQTNGEIEFAIRRIDKTSLEVTLIGNQERFTQEPVAIVANDDYLLLASGWLDRVDLSTAEVKPMPIGLINVDYASLVGDDYYHVSQAGTWDWSISRLHVAAAQKSDLLSGNSFRGMIASPDVIVAVGRPDKGEYRLLRITP